jgi:hypothetical protein
LAVELTAALVTRAIITRHLTAIADTYAENWTYDSPRGYGFATIRGVCSVPDNLTWDLGFGAEDIQIVTRGILLAGQEDGTAAGFHAYVVTETDFPARDDYEDEGTDVFVKAYPCHHVPVPANW